ncbi:RND efflux system outer membrane lipoprotein [Novosphingobium sp. Rr 2-17]|uniref:efflux transporter outer membrane subunit n=1 Tax=Novosphingobium sp. Rr 2-17 TaxID=555793 RepID=UPI0002699E58|nr:efflux transporter outer membrane subunit [Novosphingobium sp. Rr 2-17]EIZ80811.1 RND efflux system outer membrane lipoprotein [Novosphingobium sp. Rr 2-17]
MSTITLPRFAAAALLPLSFCLAACGAPNLGPRPKLNVPADLASSSSLTSDASAREWPRDQWWTAYGDTQLDALVAEALAGSPSVAAAQARIRQARGAAEISGAASLPSVTGQGSLVEAKQSYNAGTARQFLPQGWNEVGTLALSADFDLDLWGKNRKALAAATSQAEAAVADARQAELMLSSNVVSSYFDLARLIERGRALQDAVTARGTLLDLTSRRAQQGVDNQAPVRRAEAEIASARAAVAANDQQIALRRHALAALLGAGPDRGLSINPGSIAAIPVVGIPADAGIQLAGRRPDIVAARLRAQAAAKRIDVAKAEFMPDISISGLIGLRALGIGKIFDSGSDYGNVGPAISLPIFQGGRLKGQYRQARGTYDEAVANYNSTVVNALQEVADGLTSRDSAIVQERETQAASTAAAASYDLSDKRFRGGLSNYLDTLNAQTAALDARTSGIDAHFRTLAYEVALKRALGGGFTYDSKQKASDHE